ncbi:MazG-like family protein [Numidum massiliense]|uniref:MazG-like family protein n=1 Tax=Numidum massiliense TaxID=1522315 RepID=UPI0006D5A178|nr:MazG-like family protein [Numidum massiliense]
MERQQIAKNLKVLEWLKCEILDHVAAVYRHVMHGKLHGALDALASLIVAVIMMARRLGFSFRELENAVTKKLREHVRQGHQMEEWYGDLSALEEYMNKR